MVGAIPGLDYSHSALFPSVVMMIILPLMMRLKESPRWLVLKSNISAARKSLVWLFQSEKSANEIILYIQDSLPSETLSFRQKIRMFTKRSIYFPFLLLITIVFFHQYTGNNVVISYAALIFQTAQVQHAKETAIYAVGALQIVSTIISASVVDRVGRKKLLLFGSVGIAISTTLLGTHFYITESTHCTDNNNTSSYTDEGFNNYTVEEAFNATDNEQYCLPPRLSILPIASLMGFGLFYSIGWRPLPFIMMGEMFPNTIRSGINGVLLAYLWGIGGLLVGGFTPYERAVGPYIAWWVFAGIAGLSVPFVAILVPETKGKTLEEIKQYFEQKNTVRRVVAATNPVTLQETTL